MLVNTIDQYIGQHWVNMSASIGWVRTDTRPIHQPTVCRVSIEYWLRFGQVLVGYRLSIGQYVSWYVCQLSVSWVMADISTKTLMILNWHSTNTWLTLNQLSADILAMYGLSVNQYSPNISTKCQVIYWSRVWADTTYTKHDPRNLPNS